MREYKEILKKEVSDIVCDICKKSCVRYEDNIDSAEYGTIEAYWGYFSKKDGETFNCEICEDCFDKVISFLEELKKNV